MKRKKKYVEGKVLTKQMGLVFIVAVCVIVLLIGAARQKAMFLINFVMRLVMGMTIVYFVNEFLAVQHIDVAVGMNPATLLTMGSLGFPGVAALYGILFLELCKYFTKWKKMSKWGRQKEISAL